jgi:CspA family cold shock protein
MPRQVCALVFAVYFFNAGTGGAAEQTTINKESFETKIMQVGIIKKFFADRHFGFVQPDDGGADVFLHGSTLTYANINISSVREGDRVEFEVGPSPRSNRQQITEIRLIR